MLIFHKAEQLSLQIAVRLACGLCFTDRAKLALARQVAMRGKPRAAKHLNHFLCAQGQPIYLSTQQLLNEDAGVRAALIQAITQSDLDHSQTLVSQRRFAHADWRYALGSVRFNWHRHNDHTVRVCFHERYDWAPHDARPTQPLHRAATRLQQRGAKPFDMIGSSARLDLRQPCDPVYHRLLI